MTQEKTSPALAGSTIARMSLPAAPLAAILLPIVIYLPPFYANRLGLSLSSIGSLFLIARVVDGLIDPVIGILSDRTKTRFGRRRPWVVVGSILLAAAMLLAGDPPSGTGTLGAAAMIISVYVLWSAVQVPYTAWTADIAQVPLQRTRMFAAREVAGIVGILAATLAPLVLVGTEANALPQIVKVYSWLLVGLLLIASASAAVSSEPEGSQTSRRTDWNAVFLACRNRPFLRALAVLFLTITAISLNNAVIVFMVEHWWKHGSGYLGYLLAMYALSIPSSWVCQALSKSYDKRYLFAGGLVTFALGYAAMMAVPWLGSSFAWVVFAIFGFALPFIIIPMPAMAADAADYGDLRIVRDAMGSHMAIYSFVNKLATGIGIGVAFPLLEYLHFEPDQPIDGSGRFALALVGIFLPTVLLIAAAVLVAGSGLTSRRVNIVSRALGRRRGRR